MRWAFEIPFAAYRWVISPAIHAIAGPGFGCRHSVSCSDFALRELKTRGLLVGGARALRRILSCHPWGRGEYGP